MRITVSHDLSRIAQSLSRLSGKLTGSLEEPLRAIGGILESSTPPPYRRNQNRA